MIKVKANILNKYMDKATLNGTIMDAKLQFQEDGLHTVCRDAAGVAATEGFLSKDNFEEYEVVELNIKDTSKFMLALNISGKEIVNIVKEKLIVNIIDKNGSVGLVESEDITSYNPDTKALFAGLKYDGTVDISQTSINDIKTKNKIVKSSSIVVRNDKKELFLEVGEEVDQAQTKSVSVLDKEIQTKFQMTYFETLTASIEGVVKFNFGLNGLSPVKLEEVGAKYTMNYYLTPLSE